MEWLDHLFGKEDHLNTLQMSVRAVLVFLTALIIMRIGCSRTFGKEAALDNVVIILLGGVLGRVVTGASPFLPAMSACFSIILIHRLLAWICMYDHKVGNLIKGSKILLFNNGKPVTKNLKKTLITIDDLHEGIRLNLNEDDTGHVKDIFMERNGEISVVKKQGS